MLVAAVSLLFLYTAVGMLLSAHRADPPTGPGFWRLSVLLILTGVGLGLGLRLSSLGGALPPPGPIALGGWALCLLALALFGFFLALRDTTSRLLLTTALVGGVTGVVLDPVFAPTGLPPLERFLYLMGLATMVLTLGAVMLAMILAHWYLIEPRMPIEPLLRVLKIFLAAELAKVLLLVGVVAVHWAEWTGSPGGLMRALVLGDALFVMVRAFLGVAAPLGLGWMTWKTVEIRSLQSATGILYAAIVFVLFGEVISLFLQLSTGRPF